MASLVKTVELRVLADAGDAQRQLDEITAKADELDAEGVKMRFRVDDKDGQAQLDDIKAKADELGFKDVSVRVKVDGAGRAIAELAAVKDEAAKMEAESDAGGGGGGILSLLTSPMYEGDGILSTLSNPAVLAGVVAAAGAALTELTGLVSGFAAAGAGAGAFAALAYPAIEKVKTALADTPAQLKKLDLSPDESGAVAGIKSLEAEYSKLSTAFQPDAFKVFNDGLKVANSLLPTITPFADTFASSLSGLLVQLGKFTQSKGFGDFLQQFHALEGPAVTAIGDGIGKVANSVGKLLTTMSGKDVAQTIGIAFNAIAGAINGVRGAVQGTMAAWDILSSSAKTAAAAVATAWDGISSTASHIVAAISATFSHADFSGLTTAARKASGEFISFLAELPGKAQSALKSLDNAFRPIGEQAMKGLLEGLIEFFPTVMAYLQGRPDEIKGPFSGAHNWLIEAGKAIIQGLISGMVSETPSLLGELSHIALFIAEHKGPIEKDRQLLIPAGQAIMDGLMGGMASRTPALEAQLAHVTRSIASTAAADVRGAGSAMGGDSIELHFHGITTDQGTVRQMVQALHEYKRNGGGAPLGIA